LSLLSLLGLLGSPAVKYLKIVIPAEAGIQKNTGCPRLTTYRGRLIMSGMTEFVYLLAGLTIKPAAVRQWQLNEQV
jgi:hypothetical protein